MHQHEAAECGVCRVPSFERNNYFHGKTLTARDLFAEQRYFNEKRWLINRTVIGWGVVCGLEVSLEGDCLIVTPGLALDCCGRELLVCERETLHVQKVAEQLGAGPSSKPDAYEQPGTYAKPDTYSTHTPSSTQPGSSPEYAPPAAGGEYSQDNRIRWVLCLEYRECRTEAVALPPSCDQRERGREHNRIRDDYRLTFRRWTDACAEDYSADCCPYPGVGRAGSVQKTVVDASAKCPSCRECDCVVVATGWLTPSASQQAPRLELETDFWKYRRTVHSNVLLANLFRCFHDGLAHISDVSWTPGTRYKLEDFLHLLRQPLQVTFDREMSKSSVENPRSCRLSILTAPDGEGCPVQIVVPVRRIEYDGTTAAYSFDYKCAEYELRRTCHKHQRPADVELVLHGSSIVDAKGRALDAELIRDFPTGNGVEGGEFIAFYTVEP